ncbi:MAG: sulfatase-like hydrolase/transferase, partial [Maioricimonas sp. JB049]
MPRLFLQLLCLTAALLLLEAPAVADRPPNLILIMADDLGYGDISPYDGWIQTPQLERLAAGGVRLTDFHSSGNVCSPTRAGLMTGRYQQRAGIPGVVVADPKRAVHKDGLQPSEVTIAEVLKQAGYATAIFGKWHLGYDPKYNPIRHGFDRFNGYVSGNIDFFSHYDQSGNFDWWQQDQRQDEDGYVTHLIDRHANEFIRANAERPFFLYLPHEAPHYPFQGPDDEPRRSEGKGRAADDKWSRPEMRARYRQMVVEMARSIGHLLDTLEELNLDENTLVFFLSDNGAAGRYGDNSPLRGSKGSNWEGGHRVPAIVQWPGKIPAGTVRDDLAISLDILPTFLAAAGASVPDGHNLDGINLLPMLTNGQSLPDRNLVWNGRAVRDGKWKLIVDG